MNQLTAEGVFLNTVAAVLNNEKPSALPEGISADDVFELGSRRNMAPITFCALNLVMPKPVSDQWGEYQKQFLDDCMRSETQMSEYHKLVEYLCGNGVKIIPLKGCVMKELYPSPFFRAMADVDLLYEGVSTKKIAGLMEAFGYSAESLEKSHHDVFYKEPCMNVELHRQLMDDDSPYKPIFEHLFERALPDEKIPNLYHLTPADLYIHVIAHAAKHFKNQRFEEKIKTIAYAFFGDEQADVSALDMELFFPDRNTEQPSPAGWAYMERGGKNQFLFFLHKIFFPYSRMCIMYPVLKKWPVLLPFAWIHRICDRLLHNRQSIVMVARTNINEQDARRIRQLMDNFGLNG